MQRKHEQCKLRGNIKLENNNIVYLFQGKIAEAEKLFKKAQSLDANDPAAWTHYGKINKIS